MVDLLNGHIIVDGQFVSAKIEQLVRAIKDYEPYLEVKWIPAATRKEGDPAFCIRYEPPDSMPHILFFVKTEEEFDERVLAKIIHNDQRLNKTSMTELEAWEETAKLVNKRKFEDSMEEANDIAYHVFKTRKNTYKVNNDLTIRE